MAKNSLKARSPWLWVPTLYFAEGVPYVVVVTVTAIMYVKLGVSNTALAFYTSLLLLPWSLKALWSPLVDIFGTRRRWIIVMQLLLAISMAAVALALPGTMYFRLTMASFLIMGVLSATHDIAADGFYLTALDDSRQSYFVGIRTAVYRLAIILGQGPLVMLAGWLETTCGDIPRAWAITFYIMAGIYACIAFYHIFALPRPASERPKDARTLRQVMAEFGRTFAAFFRKPHIVTALLFMLLYKFPEAQLTKMISPFMLAPAAEGGLGLSTADVGYYYGTIGIVGLMAGGIIGAVDMHSKALLSNCSVTGGSVNGGIIGGMAASRGGLQRWLMPMAWSMSLTCATFIYLSNVTEPSGFAVGLCIAVEQFGYGFGTTAYILYLMRFSAGPWSSSHYAICTGIMSLGLMFPGMAAGWLQQHLGYADFFIWTLASCAITIAVSLAARRHLPD